MPYIVPDEDWARLQNTLLEFPGKLCIPILNWMANIPPSAPAVNNSEIVVELQSEIQKLKHALDCFSTMDGAVEMAVTNGHALPVTDPSNVPV